MMAWFPTPYPEETFDSLCYRYAARMKYPHKNALGADLFGARIERVSVDVPHDLAYFVAHLPPGSPITAAGLVENHSFLPYYRPFLQPKTYGPMVAQMMGERAEPNVLGALSKFRKHVPVYLRYCPECVGVDRQQHGETYWHRQHQLPGVRVCAEHAVWLEDSRVYAKHGSFAQGPIPAAAALQEVHRPPRPLDPSPPARRLLRLSQNARWVLTQQANLDADALFHKYRFALGEKGYLAQGVVHREAFLQDFLDYYSEALLDALGCGFPGQHKQRLAWLKRLTGAYHQMHFSPLQHLLLIQFLSEKASTFFALPDERCPFGAGPWPCLNKTCPHYRKPVITGCQVYAVKGRPRAEFQCVCGFTYRRWVPDQREENREAYDWVVAYGKVWDDRLRELWHETGISLQAMKEILGLGGTDTLKCHAIRLGLPFQAHRDLARGGSVRAPMDQEKVNASRQRRLATHRQRVMEMLRENPTLTRKQLAEEARASLQDLRKFDADWLNRTVPLIKYPSPVAVDWDARDEKLAQKILALVEAIKSEPGKPLRITKAEIGRRLEAKHVFANNLRKLPKTKAALEAGLESREAFAIRRLLWARDYFVEEREIPRWWALVQKAGVEKSLSPGVATLADTLLAELMVTVGNR